MPDMSNVFSALLPRRPRNVTYLELYGYNGCRYRLISPKKDKSYSVEISRPGAKNNAVLKSFTEDLGDAQGFTKFLMETGVRPEQLPHAAAAYFCVKKETTTA